MYCNVVTAIDKIPTYLLCFNNNFNNESMGDGSDNKPTLATHESTSMPMGNNFNNEPTGNDSTNKPTADE